MLLKCEMSYLENNRLRIHFTPLFVSGGVGISLAVLAFLLQDGEARGYAIIAFLFWISGLTALSVLTSIVFMAFGRLQAGLEILVSGIILLLAYILVALVIVSVFGGGE